METLTASVTLDWLTLTTWDLPAFFDLVAYLRDRHMGGWRPKKVQQYTGQSNGAIFHGTSEQRDGNGQDRGHGMIRISGPAADEVFYQDIIWYFAKHDVMPWRCTRIDLESTRMPPKRYSLPAAYKRIRQPASIIQSENITLYIGNRASSPIFVRLYQKLGYLRLELELKLGRSQWAFEKLASGTHPNDIYTHCLLKSRTPKMYVNHFKPEKSDAIDYTAQERKADAKRRLTWLQSIEPTLTTMCMDHELGLHARQVLYRIIDIANNVDRQEEE